MFKTDRGTIVLTEQEYRTLTETIVNVQEFLVKVKRTLAKEDCSTFGTNQQIAACNDVIHKFKLHSKTDEVFTKVDPLFLK